MFSTGRAWGHTWNFSAAPLRWYSRRWWHWWHWYWWCQHWWHHWQSDWITTHSVAWLTRQDESEPSRHHVSVARIDTVSIHTIRNKTRTKMVLTFSLSGMIQFTISNGCVFFWYQILSGQTLFRCLLVPEIHTAPGPGWSWGATLMKAVCWHRCPSLRCLEPEGLGIGIVGNYYRAAYFSGTQHETWKPTWLHMSYMGFLFTWK